MKKITCFFICLAVFLSLSRGVFAAGDSGKAEILFSRGVLAYNQKEYSGAEADFKEALQLNPSYATAAYFAGLSLLGQNKASEALSFFNQAAKLNDSDPEPHLYAGIVYFQLKQTEPAKEQLTLALKLASTDSVRNRAKSYLQQLGGPVVLPEKAPQKSKNNPWVLSASMATDFDSNVTLDPDNLNVASLPSDQNDFFWNLSGLGGYRLVQNQNYRLTGMVSYSQSLHAELDALNYGLAHVELKQEFPMEDLFLQLRTGYDFSILGSDKYLQSGFLSTLINYTEGAHWMTQMGPRLRDDLFFGEPAIHAQDRDALNLQVDLNQYFYLDTNRKSFFRVGYGFERNFAQGDDWKYNGHTIRGAFLTPLFWDIRLFVSADVTVDKSFDHVDSTIGTKRDDWGIASGLYLSRKVAGPLDVSVNYNYYRNSSNQDFFTYNRHLVGLTFTVNY